MPVIYLECFTGVLGLVDLTLEDHDLTVQFIGRAQAEIAMFFKIAVRIKAVVEAADKAGADANGEKIVVKGIGRSGSIIGNFHRTGGQQRDGCQKYKDQKAHDNSGLSFRGVKIGVWKWDSKTDKPHLEFTGLCLSSTNYKIHFAYTMAYIMVDVESDGPIPGDYSMISFGAVLVNDALDQTFYGQLKPISEKFIPEALAFPGFTREDTLSFNDPVQVMTEFKNWIENVCTDRAIG